MSNIESQISDKEVAGYIDHMLLETTMNLHKRGFSVMLGYPIYSKGALW